MYCSANTGRWRLTGSGRESAKLAAGRRNVNMHPEEANPHMNGEAQTNERRILITGASGKVGQAFIRRLLEDPAYRGFRIRALCHNRVLPTRDRLEVVRGS